MDIRADIAAAVDAWANYALGETYLSERLHPKARGWLIDHIETMLRKTGVSTVGPVNGPSPVKPVKPAKVEKLTVAVIEEAAAKAKEHAIKPRADGTYEVFPASAGANEGASKGPAETPAVADVVPTMEDLKGKLKGQKKGKRA